MRATRRLASFLRPYWRWAVLAPLFMVLEVAMDLLQPWLIQRIIDDGVLRSDMRVVLTTTAWMAVVAVVGLLGGMACTVFAILAGQHFGADLRGTLFRKVQSFSFGNLDRLETGGLITRLTNDVTQLQELVMLMLRIMVRVPLLLVGSLIMGILTSPQLAVLFVVLIPFVLLVLVVIIRQSFPLFGEVQRRLDALTTVLQENLAGTRVVKAFARAAHEIERFSRANNSLTEQNLKAVRVTTVTMPFMLLALNVGVVAALWIGGVRVSEGSLEIGQLVAFINYLMQTLMALMATSMLIMRVARAEASAQRVEEVLDQVPEIVNRPAALTQFAPRGRLAFENVSFSYDAEGNDPVLRDISFVVEPGQTLAILGATGAGKSSLVNLIPRFYDVSDGRITIDGVDVRAIDEQVLHRAVGVALQETVLFSGTIRDNIRYGRPEASDDEVIAAARVAQAHEFISSFPDGYDSIVGQRGVNLSGGQRQRIAIARALLHPEGSRRAVLVLDDSTSAVDVETEARIQAAFAAPGSPQAQQTRVVVAQRISSVLGADNILVLDDGRIAAQGTHAELVASSPIYREIFASQMQHGALSHGTA